MTEPLGRGLLPLYASSFMFNLGAAAALLTVTLYAIELGATPLQLGIVGMIWPATFTLTCLFVGPLSESLPRKTLPILGSAIACCSFLMVRLAQSPLHLMLIGIPAGLAFAFVWPPIEAWVAELSPSSQMRRNVGLFNLSWSIGAAPGPLIAGFAIKISITLPLAIGTAMIFAAAVVIAAWGREAEETGAYLPPSTHDSSRSAHTFLILAWVANFATYFTIGIMRSLFPKLGAQLGLDPSSIGALLSLVTASQVVTFALLARTSSWHYHLSPLLLSQLSMLVAALLVRQFSGFPAFAPVMVMMGSCAGISYFSSIYYSLNTPSGKAARTAIHEALIGTGIVAGPLTGGIVAQAWGLRAPYLVSAVVIGIGISANLILASGILSGGKKGKELQQFKASGGIEQHEET